MGKISFTQSPNVPHIVFCALHNDLLSLTLSFRMNFAESVCATYSVECIENKIMQRDRDRDQKTRTHRLDHRDIYTHIERERLLITNHLSFFPFSWSCCLILLHGLLWLYVSTFSNRHHKKNSTVTACCVGYIQIKAYIAKVKQRKKENTI